MYKNSPVFYVLIFLLCTKVYTQTSISGHITDNLNEPLFGATVLLKGTKKGTISDSFGNFIINNASIGATTLVIQYLGYESLELQLKVEKNKNLSLTIKMLESGEKLDEVVLLGKTQTQKQKTAPIKIEIIETQKYKLESASVVELINRSPGIKIRQAGGLGSNTKINLNGFQGNAVRVFKDGIPMDYLDGAYGIGFVPANSLERVEVYKGVLPASLGSDALGGAVNLISVSNKPGSRLSISYEAGSFNTHRATINANFTNNKNNFFAGVEGFFNYSDNSYSANVNYIDSITRNEVPIQVDLFHNMFRQHYVEVFAGVKNKSWADELKLSVTNFKRYRENQFGQLMQYPIGAAHNRQLGDFIPTIRYKKHLLSNKLKVDQFFAYSKITRISVDTINGSYDWLANFTPNTRTDQEPGEVGSADFTTYKRYNFTSRTTFKYLLNQQHTITLNGVYTTYSQTGTNPYGEYTLGENPVPLISLPADYNKFITGLSVDSRFIDNRLQNSLQLKYYNSYSSGRSVDELTGLVEDKEVEASISTFGLGNSLRYQLNDNLKARVSLEQATRLPSQSEVFGNGSNSVANLGLKPERSFNTNIGINYNTKNNSFSAGANMFYRNTKDLIVSVLSISTLNAVSANLDKVRGYGLELNSNYHFLNHFKVGGNITFQNFRQKGHQDEETALLDDARIQNMPYFFSNLSATADFEKVITTKDKLKAYWYYSYIHPYYLHKIPKNLEPDGFLGIFGEPGLANSELYIPKQNMHTAGLVWLPNQERQFSIGLEVKNIFDQTVFDNFKIQNAGRSFHIKLTYTFDFNTP